MKKINKNEIKIIILSELAAIFSLGLAVSIYYFVIDYSNFFNMYNNSQVFWIGFLLISLMIFSFALILSFIIMIVVYSISNPRWIKGV